jgi:hypothetical protein
VSPWRFGGDAIGSASIDTVEVAVYLDIEEAQQGCTTFNVVLWRSEVKGYCNLALLANATLLYCCPPRLREDTSINILLM